jgi:hypothetical protein
VIRIRIRLGRVGLFPRRLAVLRPLDLSLRGNFLVLTLFVSGFFSLTSS